MGVHQAVCLFDQSTDETEGGEGGNRQKATDQASFLYLRSIIEFGLFVLVWTYVSADSTDSTVDSATSAAAGTQIVSEEAPGTGYLDHV